MPIYEYKCKDCNKAFEKLVFGEDEVFCPECNSNKVEKQLSLCGVFTKDGNGEVKSATPSACAGCTATSCAGCS